MGCSLWGCLDMKREDRCGSDVGAVCGAWALTSGRQRERLKDVFKNEVIRCVSDVPEAERRVVWRGCRKVAERAFGGCWDFIHSF